MSTPPREDLQAEPATLEALLAAERERLKQLFPLAAAKPRPPRLRALPAAGASLCLGLALLVWANPVWQSEQHASGIGERREITLRDGSQLTLDTQTELSVSWRLRSREIRLAQGRARFSVAPSAWRHLSVSTDLARVTVLGTVFDVTRRAGATEVAVLRGRVAAAALAEPQAPAHLMTPGQRLRVLANGRLQPLPASSAADDGQASWVSGQLVFQHTPLREAMAELQRYRRAAIRIHGAEVAELQISGVFDSSQLEPMLDLLPRILPLRLHRQADGSLDLQAR